MANDDATIPVTYIVMLDAGNAGRRVVVQLVDSDHVGAHPETAQMRPEDGIYLALKSLYPCK